MATQLGQMWAVYVYAEWENNFRPRLAAAHSCSLNQISAYTFGDLRRLRHDVLHHRAIATEEWTGRCELLHWFKPGEQLIILGEHIADFMSRVPWAELKEGPTAEASAVRE